MTPHSKLAYLVVGGQLMAFLICVGALCGTLFYKNYSDPVVLTALISLTSVLGGNLSSILGGPRGMMLAADAIADKISEKILTTKIDQPANNPIPVAETIKPAESSEVKPKEEEKT